MGVGAGSGVGVGAGSGVGVGVGSEVRRMLMLSSEVAELLDESTSENASGDLTMAVIFTFSAVAAGCWLRSHRTSP